jgi:cobalt-zinc-cadmium efflux system outer membrane protein
MITANRILVSPSRTQPAGAGPRAGWKTGHGLASALTTGLAVSRLPAAARFIGMERRFPKGAIVVIAWAALHGLAWGAPQEVTPGVALDTLVAEALKLNPQVRSIRAQWEASREGPAQQRALPNPTLTYSGMDQVNGGNWPNTEEKRFMLEQEFPWFGKRGLRGEVADKEAEAMQREYEVTERDLIQMVKESYFELYGVQRALSIIRAEEEVLRRVESVATTKYSTGEVSQQDALKAQSEISMLRGRIYDLEQQEVTLKAKINQLLARRADAPLGLAITPPDDGFDVGLETLLAIANERRPEIRVAEAGIERGQAERDVMKKEFFPDYRLGLEYRGFRTGDDMLMFTLGIDLPIWRGKYKAGVRQAEKMIESAVADKKAAETRAAFDVRDAQFKVLTSRRTHDLYRNVLVPQAQARFEASEAGYQTGRVDFLDLLESERFLLDARIMAAMAEGNVGVQAALLERAIGTDLKTTVGPEGDRE